MVSILILDDDLSVRESLRKLFLSRHWDDIREAASIKDGLRILTERHAQQNPFDVAVVDMHFGGKREDEGIDFIAAALRIDPVCQFVVLTQHASVGNCAKAMQSGAIEYIPKPCGDRDLLDAIVRAQVRRGFFKHLVDVSHDLAALEGKLSDLGRKALQYAEDVNKALRALNPEDLRRVQGPPKPMSSSACR